MDAWQEFAIKAVDLDTFHQALEAKDLEQIKTIQSAMQVSSQCISDHPLVSTCGVNGSENVYVALEHELSRLESGQINHHLPFGQDQKPVLIKTNADGSLLFCLTDSGELVLVCGLTMLKIDAFQELHGKVLGFSLLAEEGQTERFQILMTVSRDDCFFLQMRDFPSFELVYEIEVRSSVVSKRLDLTFQFSDQRLLLPSREWQSTRDAHVHRGQHE